MVSPGNIRDILVEQKLTGERSASSSTPTGASSRAVRSTPRRSASPRTFPVACPHTPGVAPWARGVDSRGVAVYFTAARSNVSGWTAVVAVPAEVIDRPFWRSARAVATGGLGFLLLGILVADHAGPAHHRAAPGPVRRRLRPLLGPAHHASALAPSPRCIRLAGALLDAGYQRADAERVLPRPRGSPLRHRQPGDRRHRAVDLEGRFTFVNDRFCEIVGRPRDELLAQHMEDITHRDDVRTFRRDPRRARRQRTEPHVRDPLHASRRGGGLGQSLRVAHPRARGARLRARRRDGDHRQEGGGGGARGPPRARAAGAGGGREANKRQGRVPRHPLPRAADPAQLPPPLGAACCASSRSMPDTLAKAIDTIDRNAALQAQLIDDLLDISRIASGKLRLSCGRSTSAPSSRRRSRPCGPPPRRRALQLAPRPRPRRGARARRRDAAAAGAVEPPHERAEVHPRRRADRGLPAAACRPGRAPRARHRPGHRPRAPAAHLRPLPSGRQQHHAAAGRPRASASPSPASSWSCTAAPSGRRARARGRARR